MNASLMFVISNYYTIGFLSVQLSSKIIFQSVALSLTTTLLIIQANNSSSGGFMKQLYLLLVLSLLTPICLAQPELKGNPIELRQFLSKEQIVTLSAQAEERAYSDQAIIGLIVTTEKKLLSDSITSNRTLREILTQDLIKAGIEKEKIKSSKFSSSPQYGWFGKNPTSFEVVNRLSITINEEKHLEIIAKLTDQYEQIVLGNTEFKHSEEEKYRQLVKEKALQKILKQKELYESRLDVSLTTVGFSDSQIYAQPTRGASVIEEIVVAGTRRSQSDSYVSSVKQRSVKGTTSFDEVKYQANISVRFKID